MVSYILYYASPAFGGDKDEVKNYFRKAISLFAKHPKKASQNWLYLSLLTQIGQMQVEQGEYTEAKKTLKAEPNYKYVRDELLPALEKKR